jgi:hypothetical protein
MNFVTKRSPEAPKAAKKHSPQEQAASVGRTKPLAKSADPTFMKFTTYIRKTTHLGVKTRLVSKEKELSDLVEELLSNWLKENNSFGA